MNININKNTNAFANFFAKKGIDVKVGKVEKEKDFDIDDDDDDDDKESESEDESDKDDDKENESEDESEDDEELEEDDGKNNCNDDPDFKIDDEELDDTENESEDEDSNESEDEAKDEVIEELVEQHKKLLESFSKQTNEISELKSTITDLNAKMEALLSASRIQIGIKASEEAKKKVETCGTICKVSGGLVYGNGSEYAGLVVKQMESGLRLTKKSVILTHKYATIANDVFGEVPQGKWVLVTNKKNTKFFLVNKVNLISGEESCEEPCDDGIILNKKGSVIGNHLRGKSLKVTKKGFVLHSDKDYKKRISASFTKNCKRNFVGKVPSGEWTIVEDENEEFWLVPSETIESSKSNIKKTTRNLKLEEKRQKAKLRAMKRK